MKPPHGDGRRIRVLPGGYHVTSDATVIHTLLGSCVAACLYDPDAGVAGMNHFLLANRRYPQEMALCLSEAGRYGIHAMELLINEMLRRGARRNGIRCKAFGGGQVVGGTRYGDSFPCVGSVNERFIREFLSNEGIPLVASDLGGDSGRVIYFDCRDYAVYVRHIGKSRNRVLAERDRLCWERRLARQAREETEIDLWQLGPPPKGVRRT